MKNTCDHLISETNALGKTRTFTYDAAGNRTSLTDRNGKTRRFSFDAFNRLTKAIAFLGFCKPAIAFVVIV